MSQEIRQKSPGEVDGGEGGRLGGGEEMGTAEGKGETLALEERLKSTGESEVEEGEHQNQVWVPEAREYPAKAKKHEHVSMTPEITAFLLILRCLFTCGDHVIELGHRKAKQC